MSWGSLESFLAMGGYGLYVWGSYAVAALCVVFELWLLARRTRVARTERLAPGERAA